MVSSIMLNLMWTSNSPCNIWITSWYTTTCYKEKEDDTIKNAANNVNDTSDDDKENTKDKMKDDHN